MREREERESETGEKMRGEKMRGEGGGRGKMGQMMREGWDGEVGERREGERVSERDRESKTKRDCVSILGLSYGAGAAC